jgi:hypothetical protein
LKAFFQSKFFQGAGQVAVGEHGRLPRGAGRVYYKSGRRMKRGKLNTLAHLTE